MAGGDSSLLSYPVRVYRDSSVSGCKRRGYCVCVEQRRAQHHSAPSIYPEQNTACCCRSRCCFHFRDIVLTASLGKLSLHCIHTNSPSSCPLARSALGTDCIAGRERVVR